MVRTLFASTYHTAIAQTRHSFILERMGTNIDDALVNLQVRKYMSARIFIDILHQKWISNIWFINQPIVNDVSCARSSDAPHKY